MIPANMQISTPAGDIGPPGARFWIVAGVTDLRRGFTGLSGLVQTTLELDVYKRQGIPPPWRSAFADPSAQDRSAWRPPES